MTVDDATRDDSVIAVLGTAEAPPPPQRHHRTRPKDASSMLQLRIYTVESADALQRYATIHWARHVSTFATFGVTTRGVWTERGDGVHRLVALIEYPPGADPDDTTERIMASPEFAADMAGFDVADIVDVQSLLLDPTPYSPFQQRI